MQVRGKNEGDERRRHLSALRPRPSRRRRSRRKGWSPGRAGQTLGDSLPKLDIPDPLVRPQKTGWAATVSAALLFVFAFALHAFILLVFLGVGNVADRFAPQRESRNERISVDIVAPPPPPVMEEIEVEEVDAVPLVPKPKLKPKPKPTPKQELAADPIDVAPEVAPAEVTPPVKKRRVVGLSFESTVMGGGGPSFAVGNTRMGNTKKVAEDAKQVEKLEPRKLNQKATRVPMSGVQRTKPKRLEAVQPIYPKVLRQQGIEADVTVSISISAEGRVTRVRLIKGGGHDAFDQAALDAAQKQRFTPATRDGEPVAYSLKYTYRFRLNDL